MGQRLLLVVVTLVSAAALAFLAARWLDERQAPPIVITALEANSPIMVSVAGAVATPGLYSLPQDARVTDALSAAGEPVREADLSSLNLAAPLEDGQRIVVPLRPTRVPAILAEAPAGAPTTTVSAPAALLDMNTATAAELEALPGIGPALAARIVEYRTVQGPFTGVEGLLAVPGIGEATLDELRALITVGQ